MHTRRLSLRAHRYGHALARAAISTYCLFQRKNCAVIVALWERQLGKADATQQLALLYLANDIIQKSRKKGPEYTNEFFKVRPRLCARRARLACRAIPRVVRR